MSVRHLTYLSPIVSAYILVVLLWAPVEAQVKPAPLQHHHVKAVIDGPQSAAPGDLVVLDSNGSNAVKARKWLLTNSDRTFLPVDNNTKVVFASGTPGQYNFVLVCAGLDEDGKVDLDATTFKLTIGGPTPPLPPGPNPPTPEPPIPPTPPTPIPSEGFRVLVVYEKDDLDNYSKGQLEVLQSTAVRSYLIQKCIKGPDGKTPEYRFFDDDTNVENESKIWQDALKLPRTSLPWVIVTNGKAGESIPIPADTDQDKFLEFLKKYGG